MERRLPFQRRGRGFKRNTGPRTTMGRRVVAGQPERVDNQFGNVKHDDYLIHGNFQSERNDAELCDVDYRVPGAIVPHQQQHLNLSNFESQTADKPKLTAVSIGNTNEHTDEFGEHVGDTRRNEGRDFDYRTNYRPISPAHHMSWHRNEVVGHFTSDDHHYGDIQNATVNSRDGEPDDGRLVSLMDIKTSHIHVGDLRNRLRKRQGDDYIRSGITDHGEDVTDMAIPGSHSLSDRQWGQSEEHSWGQQEKDEFDGVDELDADIRHTIECGRYDDIDFQVNVDQLGHNRKLSEHRGRQRDMGDYAGLRHSDAKRIKHDNKGTSYRQSNVEVVDIFGENDWVYNEYDAHQGPVERFVKRPGRNAIPLGRNLINKERNSERDGVSNYNAMSNVSMLPMAGSTKDDCFGETGTNSDSSFLPDDSSDTHQVGSYNKNNKRKIDIIQQSQFSDSTLTQHNERTVHSPVNDKSKSEIPPASRRLHEKQHDNSSQMNETRSSFGNDEIDEIDEEDQIWDVYENLEFTDDCNDNDYNKRFNDTIVDSQTKFKGPAGLGVNKNMLEPHHLSGEGNFLLNTKGRGHMKPYEHMNPKWKAAGLQKTETRSKHDIKHVSVWQNQPPINEKTSVTQEVSLLTMPGEFGKAGTRRPEMSPSQMTMTRPRMSHMGPAKGNQFELDQLGQPGYCHPSMGHPICSQPAIIGSDVSQQGKNETTMFQLETSQPEISQATGLSVKHQPAGSRSSAPMNHTMVNEAGMPCQPCTGIYENVADLKYSQANISHQVNSTTQADSIKQNMNVTTSQTALYHTGFNYMPPHAYCQGAYIDPNQKEQSPISDKSSGTYSSEMNREYYNQGPKLNIYSHNLEQNITPQIAVTQQPFQQTAVFKPFITNQAELMKQNSEPNSSSEDPAVKLKNQGTSNTGIIPKYLQQNNETTKNQPNITQNLKNVHQPKVDEQKKIPLPNVNEPPPNLPLTSISGPIASTARIGPQTPPPRITPQTPPTTATQSLPSILTLDLSHVKPPPALTKRHCISTNENYKYYNEVNEFIDNSFEFTHEGKLKMTHQDLANADEFRDELVAEIVHILADLELSYITFKKLQNVISKQLKIDFVSIEELKKIIDAHPSNFKVIETVTTDDEDDLSQDSSDSVQKLVQIVTKTDVIFCRKQTFLPNYEGKCSCNALHICKFYLLNECLESQCRFGHTVKTAHNIQVLKNHSLHRMTVGQFISLVRNKENINVIAVPGVCRAYNTTRSCNRDNENSCQFLHLCKYHLKGRCIRKYCKLGHDPRLPQPFHLLSMYGLNPSNVELLVLNEILIETVNKMEKLTQQSEDLMKQDSISRTSVGGSIVDTGTLIANVAGGASTDVPAGKRRIHMFERNITIKHSKDNNGMRRKFEVDHMTNRGVRSLSFQDMPLDFKSKHSPVSATCNDNANVEKDIRTETKANIGALTSENNSGKSNSPYELPVSSPSAAEMKDNTNLEGVPALCKFYNYDRGCRKRDWGPAGFCFFLHICEDFINGICENDEDCKLSHDLYSGQPAWILGKYGLVVEELSQSGLSDLMGQLKKSISNTKQDTQSVTGKANKIELEELLKVSTDDVKSAIQSGNVQKDTEIENQNQTLENEVTSKLHVNELTDNHEHFNKENTQEMKSKQHNESKQVVLQWKEGMQKREIVEPTKKYLKKRHNSKNKEDVKQRDDVKNNEGRANRISVKNKEDVNKTDYVKKNDGKKELEDIGKKDLKKSNDIKKTEEMKNSDDIGKKRLKKGNEVNKNEELKEMDKKHCDTKPRGRETKKLNEVNKYEELKEMDKKHCDMKPLGREIKKLNVVNKYEELKEMDKKHCDMKTGGRETKRLNEVNKYGELKEMDTKHCDVKTSGKETTGTNTFNKDSTSDFTNKLINKTVSQMNLKRADKQNEIQATIENVGDVIPVKRHAIKCSSGNGAEDGKLRETITVTVNQDNNKDLNPRIIETKDTIKHKLKLVSSANSKGEGNLYKYPPLTRKRVLKEDANETKLFLDLIKHSAMKEIGALKEDSKPCKVAKCVDVDEKYLLNLKQLGSLDSTMPDKSHCKELMEADNVTHVIENDVTPTNETTTDGNAYMQQQEYEKIRSKCTSIDSVSEGSTIAKKVKIVKKIIRVKRVIRRRESDVSETVEVLSNKPENLICKPEAETTEIVMVEGDRKKLIRKVIRTVKRKKSGIAISEQRLNVKPQPSYSDEQTRIDTQYTSPLRTTSNDAITEPEVEDGEILD